jgi:ATP adenylyltransferase
MHKHLQMIPLPGKSFASFLDEEGGEEPEVSFQWFWKRLGEREVTPDALKEEYDDLLERATKSFPQKEDGPDGGVCPHNFLLTKRWMLVIPRREWGISKEAGVNAVGMIGVMPCSTQSEMNSWIEAGVSKSLAEVGVPSCG